MLSTFNYIIIEEKLVFVDIICVIKSPRLLLYCKRQKHNQEGKE